MGSRRIFRPRFLGDELMGDRGTKRERLCGWPSNTVGVAVRQPRVECEVRASAQPESFGVDTQEKPVREPWSCPYRKPTQVGEASSLR